MQYYLFIKKEQSRAIQFVVILLALMIATPLNAQKPVAERKIVKVLSFNILGGRTTKGDFNLDALAKIIKETNPDLVAMQEVDFGVNRSKKYDLATELGWRTKMAPLFGRAMYYDGGEYGEGILSKYSFLKTRNIALPFLENEEPRTALEVLVELPTKDTIAFIGTHFAHEGNAGRELQAIKINEVFSDNKFPTILAGDLNAIPGSQPINILEEIWQSTYDKKKPKPTFPSNNPKFKLDYVMFFPKNQWKIIDRKVICDTYATDHCVYLVTLELL